MALQDLKDRLTEVEVEIKAIGPQTSPERKTALYDELMKLQEYVNRSEPAEEETRGYT